MDAREMKLHLLILLSLVGIAFYLFLVFKELKSLETEVLNSKIQISLIDSEVKALRELSENTNNTITTTTTPNSSIKDNIKTNVIVNHHQIPVTTKTVNQKTSSNNVYFKPEEVVDVHYDDDDDNASIDSAEIKDILTRKVDMSHIDINSVDNDDEQSDIDSINIDETTNSSYEKHTVKKSQHVSSSPDLFLLSEVELLQLKYEELRYFLRKHSINMKGSKQELVSKILSIKPE